MNKNLLIALFAVAGVAPLTAHAQAESYVSVHAGRSELKATVDNLGSAKRDDTGYRIALGSKLSNNFGVETGFVQQAKIEVDDVFVYSVFARPQTLYIAGTGTFPLSQRFALFGKVGVAFNRTEFADNLGSEKFSETAPMAGIGMLFNITPEFTAVLEYENYGKLFKEEDTKLVGSMVSLGLRYNF